MIALGLGHEYIETPSWRPSDYADIPLMPIYRPAETLMGKDAPERHNPDFGIMRLMPISA
jgi:hypothetical protein